MVMERLAEGDYVETHEGTIWAVKGSIHPNDFVVALPVYVKHGSNKRRLRSFKESMKLVASRFPSYIIFDEKAGQHVPMVPLSEVRMFYKALEWESLVTARDPLSRKASKIVEEICSRGVDRSYVGITGSLLLGLHREESDIDVVVYGEQSCEKAYMALNIMRREHVTKKISDKTLCKIKLSRPDTKYDLSSLAFHESRKLLVGEFMGSLYTVKLVLMGQEAISGYGMPSCTSLGKVTAVCEVRDDKLAKYTPCLYRVNTLFSLSGPYEAFNVKELFSMRSRFSEQAFKGETVRVTGRLEMARYEQRSVYRIFLGNEECDEITLIKI